MYAVQKPFIICKDLILLYYYFDKRRLIEILSMNMIKLLMTFFTK